MDYGWALLLGAIQGLTEFLPVSSSGHLALAGHWGLGIPQPSTFDLALHLATLGVVAVAFARDLLRFFRQERRVLLWLAVGSAPAAVMGLGFGRIFEKAREHPPAIACGLLFTALVLWLAGRAFDSASPAPAPEAPPAGKDGGVSANVPDAASDDAGWPGGAVPPPAPAATLENLGWGRSLAIGVMQAVALLPGVSRSGMTLAAGLAGGLPRDDAVRFAFCLMLPAVGGASLLQALKLWRDPALRQAEMIAAGPLLAGMAMAALAGWLALRVLFGVVRRGKLGWFSLYCAGLALAAFIVDLNS